MSDRDFYWFGGGADLKPTTSGNWKKLNGDPWVASYPGDGGGDDRAFFTSLYTTVPPINDTIGSSLTASRGFEMDAVFAAANPGWGPADVQSGLGMELWIWGGICIAYGNGELLGINHEHSLTDMHLMNGTCGMASGVTSAQLALHVHEGAHTVWMVSGGGEPSVTLYSITASCYYVDLGGQGINTISIDYTAQDAVQPGVSDVRSGIEFGVEGHTKMGTLPAPDPTVGPPTRGYECKLYRNAGSYAVPSWVEISLTRDLSLPMERNEYDGTTRASGGFEAAVAGLLKAPLDFDHPWVTENESFQALLSAFLNNTEIELAVMDGPIDTPGKIGLRATMTVLKFDEGQPLNGIATAAISAKPHALAAHTPEWVTVPE